MLAEAERFPLHLEVPPVLHGTRAELAPGGERTFAVGIVGGNHRGLCLQLVEQRLERTGDAHERGGALVAELPQEPGVSVYGAGGQHPLHCRSA